MRNAIKYRSQKGVIRITLLALLLLATAPGQVLAEEQSCNPDLDFTILNEGPFFLNDDMRITANLGARDIVGGNYQDISAFGFALNCHLGEDFHSCTDAGNKVEFLGNPTTDCTNANGDPAVLIVPQSNIIPIKVATSPIRTGANDQCNVQFDMKVTEVVSEDNMVVQAMGWPIDNEAPTRCDNGLTSSATSTIAFEVNTCEIDVIKEVWSPLLQDWVDANTEQSAPRLGPDDRAAYRLRVSNKSTVDFIGDLHVVDNTLGVDGFVTPDFDQDGNMIIGGGDESVFDLEEACSALLESGEGFFLNTASVEGTCRSADHSMGAVTAIDSDVAMVDCRRFDPRLSSILVVKTTNGEDANAPPGPYIPVGDAVTWGYTVYNTGNEGLTIDSLVDDLEGDVTCDDTFLEKDEFTTCTSIVGVAQAGQYANVATVEATSDYTNSKRSDTDPSHYFGMVASIDLVKTPDPLIYESVGQLITYNFKVTNTSNVPLTNVHVTDPLPGLSTIVCPKSELAVDESMDCTATYNITQADMNATFVDNTATAHGTDPNGGEVTDEDSATINTEPVYALGLVKTALPLTYDEAGDVIAYSYELTNTGNQTLYAPYGVADDKTTVTCPAEPASLAPGASVTCAASYTILPGDVTAGSVTNTAQGTAKDAPEGGNDVNSNEDDETVYYIAITIRKQISDGEGGWLDADTADAAPVDHWPAGALYRLIVENTGMVDLVNVEVSDPSLSDQPYSIGSLAVGAEVTVYAGDWAVLSVESACTESGDVQNTATATGDAATSGMTVSDSDDAWLSCVGTPDILVKKYISIDDGTTWVDGVAGPVPIGSGALYKITVENTGDVDLVDVEIDDTKIPNGPYVVGDLAVDEIVEVTSGEWADLSVAEVCGSSGRFQNVADAIGTSAEYDEDVTDTDDAFLDCIGPPMISILKEVSLDNGATWHDANVPPYPTAVVDTTADTALYRITVTNVGTVDLLNVVVNDVQLGIVNHLVGSLVPGEEAVLDSGVIAALSQSDVCTSRGEKTNLATATGSSAAGQSADEASDSATIDCIGDPEIRIVKEVSADGVNWYDAEVTALAPNDAYYRITVSNIGNVALENVVVSDSILGITDYAVGTLAIGESVVIAHDGSGDMMLADLHVPGLCTEAGSYPNTAMADGKAVDSTETVHAEDDALFICEIPVDICDEVGRPRELKMRYEGFSLINHHQGASAVIVPEVVALPAVGATLKLYDGKGTLEDTVVLDAGDPFKILGWHQSGKIPPNIHIEIFEGTTLKQSITFHGSCSAPLVVGDQFGGVSIIGYTAF